MSDPKTQQTAELYRLYCLRHGETDQKIRDVSPADAYVQALALFHRLRGEFLQPKAFETHLEQQFEVEWFQAHGLARP